MRASLSVILFVHWCALAAVGAAGADGFSSLGYRDDTVIVGGNSDQCSGILVYNHDFSFENAYCWGYGGIVPPYYGAFGEAFDVGSAYIDIECGVYWLTQIGYFTGEPMDAYVWEGGVTGPPTRVLCTVPGVTGLHISFWPTCTMNEVEITCCLSGEFTVGSWADFAEQTCQWYWCADENGFSGFPWTNVAPGIGYPTGWQHPRVVFPGCVSMGIGATITEEPSPIESVTWGTIKTLFQR